MSVGRIEGWRIRWLPDVPYEVSPANGILRARFLDLRGFAEPVLEVWSKTHRENGGIDLYRVTDNALVPIIHIVAYDNHFEDVFDPEGWQKYGGGWYACSTVFRDKQLQVEYLYDEEHTTNVAHLRGVRQIFCSRSHDTEAELIYEEDAQDSKQLR